MEEKKNEEATTQSNIMRYEFADYLDTTGKEEYHLMNTGFTSLGQTFGAQEDSVQYVGDKNASSTVTSYEPEFPYEAELIKEQECTTALYETGDEQKTGSDAMFNYIRVRLWEPKAESENEFNAKKYRVSNVISDGPAEPGKATMSGTLKPVGSFIKGTFNITTRKFTPNE